MKSRHFLSVIAIVVSLFYMQTGLSQGIASLYVSSMPGFPELPQDTAFEQQAYTFEIIVKNNTNTTINTPMSINMQVDSSIVIIASILQPILLAGDSLTLNVSSYNFTQPLFKAGNNIVVVWPSLNPVLSVMVDTIVKDVFFVPLNGLTDNSLMQNNFSLYPVPASSVLYLSTPNMEVEYVRIYNTSGQLLSEKTEVFNGMVDIRFLKPGIYFVEALLDGRRRAVKFVKY